MSSLLRTAKYGIKGYSNVQSKTRDATSNDPQPPTGGQMNELAQLSYNPDDFLEIAAVLDKRLDDKGRNWRHVYKSLVVLDYLLHSGSEAVILYFQKNSYVVKTLKEFQYIDEEAKDQGANVRIKAADIASLLLDESRLRQIRKTRAEMRDRMLGRAPSMSLSSPIDEDLENENVQRRSALIAPSEDDAARLQSAMAQIRQVRATEERDLLKAMRLSQGFPSEEKSASTPKPEPMEVPAQASASDDFFNSFGGDHTPQQAVVTQPFGNESLPLVVFDGMNENTSQLVPQIAPQFTSCNPFQIQMQQDMFQAEQLRQQQDWAQMQAAQQLQQQQELWLQQQYMQQQQMLQQQQQQLFQFSQFQMVQPIQPQPTGFRSNNPFAPSPAPSLISISSSDSSLPSPATPPLPTVFAPSPTDIFSKTSFHQPQRKTTNPFPTVDTQHLDTLFANRDDNGMDTFGNFGQLRYGQTYNNMQST